MEHVPDALESKNKPLVAQRRCSHWWVFESQGNPTSKGTCKFCGGTTECSNSLPDYLFENGLPPAFFLMNRRRAKDNNIERIINDKRFPHVFQRHYLDKKYEPIV